MRRSCLMSVVVQGLLLFQLINGFVNSHENGASSLQTSLAPSPSPNNQEVSVVATVDGTFYLVDTANGEVKWSFSSGQRIYSSYQAVSVDGTGLDRHNASEPDSGNDFYYLDCGDEWELYLHSKRLGKLQKLGLTADEYIRRLPHVWNDGQITLGLKKTTAFVLDAQTGKVINLYNTDVAPSTYGLQGTTNPVLLVNGGDASATNDLTKAENIIYITRTDYVLRHFSPNSSEVMWSLAFADIEAELRCQTLGISVRGIDSNRDESSLGENWNLPCQMRTSVLRIRDIEVLQVDKLPFAQLGLLSHFLPDSDTAIRPLLPATLLAPVEASFLPAEGLLALPTSEQNIRNLEPSKPDVGSPNHAVLMWSAMAVAVVTSLAAFVWCNPYVKRSIDDSTKESKPQSAISKRKKNRKAAIRENIVRPKAAVEEDSSVRKLSFNFSYSAEFPSEGRRIGKLVISSKEIAKGSNGTVVLEGAYDGRAVAVKRLVQSHHDIALKEIQNLIASDQHPNIVRWHGVEHDPDFIYIALERCTCSLNDLICADEGNSELRAKAALWKPNGYPSRLLLKLMRDVVRGLAHLHELGMIHRDLKPQNVLILSDKCVSAKLSDMGISKRLVGDVSCFTQNATGCGSSGWQAPEQLTQGRQTRAMDLFSLGCVMFFCITRGKHPFGDTIERDVNIVNDRKDLFLVDNIPEVVDLLSSLLHHNPDDRPKARDVLNHPLFWESEKRLGFLQDASDRVELEDREDGSELLEALEQTAATALDGKWDEKMEHVFLSNIGRYRRYRYDSVRDLLRVIRNKSHHYRELPPEVKSLLGSHPEGFEGYFAYRFPKLLIQVYRVFCRYCKDEEFFRKYSDSPDVISVSV